MSVSGLVAESRGRALFLRLDRPEKRNALTPGILSEIRRLLALAGESGDHRVIVITGGEHFSAGYDTTELGADAERGRRELSRTLLAVEEHPLPVIAAVDGNCIGAGFELALSCDFRVAATTARFIMPPARLGIVYPAAGVSRLVEAVGPAWAGYMLYTAEGVDGSTGATIGLVQRLVAPDGLDAETDRLAALIADERAPLSVRGAKEMIRTLRGGVSRGALAHVARLDGLVNTALDSDDHREGLRAFSERRPPDFRGA